MTTVHRSRYWGGRRRGRGRRAAMLSSYSASDAFAAIFVVLFVVVSLTIFVVERDDSPSNISYAAASESHRAMGE